MRTKDLAVMIGMSPASVRNTMAGLPHEAQVTPHGATRWTRGDSVLLLVAQELRELLPMPTACQAVAASATEILAAAEADKPLWLVAWNEGGEWRRVITADKVEAAQAATEAPAGVAVFDLALIGGAAHRALDAVAAKLEA